MLHTIGIQDLALELVQEIVLCASSQRWDDKAPSKSVLTTLRRISRPFKHAADPLLFAEITFDFSRRPMWSVVDQLNDLVTQTTPASEYTRKLDIRSTRTVEVNSSGGDWPIEPQEFVLLLLRAMKALQNLRSLRLRLDAFEGLHTFLVSFPELDRLEELDLNFFPLFRPWQPPGLFAFIRFRNLRSIKIHWGPIPPEHLNSLLLELRKLNPSLEVLECDVSARVTKPPNEGEGSSLYNDCFLHGIIEGVPETSPLKLKRLRVNGWSLRLDSMTLPHLRRLTHLDINQYKPQPDRLANMWNVLDRESIHLRSIQTDTFSEQFISYLLSYSGLEELGMSSHRDMHTTSLKRDRHGRKSVLQTIVGDLYKSALPNHKDTLKVFVDWNRSDVARCVSPDYMLSMQHCHKLQKMRVTVDQAELDPPENIQETLTAALNIPSLQTLEVDYTCSPPRRRGCGYKLLRRTNVDSTSEVAQKKFMDIVKSLEMQGNVNRDLSSCLIVFGQRRYIAVKEDELGLRFSESAE